MIVVVLPSLQKNYLDFSNTQVIMFDMNNVLLYIYLLVSEILAHDRNGSLTAVVCAITSDLE